MKFICSAKLLLKRLDDLRPTTDWIKSTELVDSTLILTNSSDLIGKIEVQTLLHGGHNCFDHEYKEGFGWEMARLFFLCHFCGWGLELIYLLKVSIGSPRTSDKDISSP